MTARHTANHPASPWRPDHTASFVTVGGLAVCPSNLLIELSITPPLGGGLPGVLTPFRGGLPSCTGADRQAANGDMGVAR